MPTIQTFDELNALRRKGMGIDVWSTPINRYFNEMRLSRAQKQERIALAEDIEDAVLFFFSLVLLQSRYAYLAAMDSAEAKEELRRRVTDAVRKHADVNEDTMFEINQYVDNVDDTTTEHLIILNELAEDAEEEKRQKERHYISEDRARLLAEEEANTIFNGSDFFKARSLGYKYKTWVTMRDSRVRKSHAGVDDKTIPINDYFLVGNSLMRFPRDTSLGASPKEIIMCRCTVQYTKE